MRKRYTYQLTGFGKYDEVVTEIKEPRPEGYYWCKYEGQWLIVEWCKDGWVFLQHIGFCKDEHFDRIHEEMIEMPYCLK